MFDGIPIINYQQTKAVPLLHLTEKLFRNNAFDSYLTPQQLIVLEFIITIANDEGKVKIWQELLEGNLSLNVLNENTTPPKPETTTENDGFGDSSAQSHMNNEDDGNGGDDDDDFSQLDLEELKQSINGPNFIGNLSLKLRYVLWQFAINGKNQDDEIHFDDDDPEYVDDDYILLDEEDDALDMADVDNTKSEINEQKKDGQPLGNIEREDGDYDEDDDYDMDETTKSNSPAQPLTEDSTDVIQLEKDSNDKSILTMKISKETLTKLRPTNINGILSNWRNIYHNFEYDKETMLKRLKLEKNNELIESGKNKRSHSESNKENSEDTVTNSNENKKETPPLDSESQDEHDGKRPKQDSVGISSNFGIASLSIKHLLSSIADNKSKLDISDYELKHLLVDVRKNRSKWASDEKIGQEELYEACEKVVLELRNYTEHSTPFLNKVSKREAPNYHQVIKKSMDLNTVLKKLKTFQYRSKQEFVDDILLIWKNCLTYNSDPTHFLRAHAIAMQKKSLQLIPMIPNITIKKRAEVEREMEEMEKDKDYEEEEEGDEEVAGSGRKGLNMGAHKPVNQSENEVQDATTKDNTPAISEKDDAAQQSHEDKQNGLEDDKGSKLGGGTDSTSEVKNEQTENVVNSDNGDSNSTLEDKKEKENSEATKNVESDQQNNVEDDEEAEEDEDEDEDKDEEGNYVNSQSYLLERDNDKDDIEISIWKTLTAKVRAEICLKRSEYFKDSHLNAQSAALLKNPKMMKPFDELFSEYKTQKELELYSQRVEQQSIMKNSFGAVIKTEDVEQSTIPNANMLESSLFDKGAYEIDIDNTTFLQEYDTNNIYPDLVYSGIDKEEIDKHENAIIESVVEEGVTKKSAYLKNINKGLTPKINNNISLIQQIRHICHKISLIRMLQSPHYMQGQRNVSPTALLNAHQYKYDDINDEIDLDPVSQLPTHDSRDNKKLMWKLMHKNVSKISMTNGFETAEPAAVNMLTSLAGEYLSNLIKTVKIHTESDSLNKMKREDILKISLLENGISRPDDLYTYLESEFGKKPRKLKDVKMKLENFLKDLLRPTLKELSERNFDDESQSFLTGDFATELTGEDFFGFKELGLEKEFGVLSSSVPLQLLSSQFQATDGETKVQVKKLQPEEFEKARYSRIPKDYIDSTKCSMVLKPFLQKAYERSKLYATKPPKGVTIEEKIKRKETNLDSPSYILLEDDEVIVKTKGTARLRLPPTGKISTAYKKKPISDAFILPEEPIAPKTEVIPKPPTDSETGGSFALPHDEPNPTSDDAPGANSAVAVDSSLLSDIDVSNTGSFSLSLPKIEER
ncbi:similar to Saccharomyces cerevisiae YBR081C SPT7 Subunit of the SAGA transcriptional regulatory complex, involved in proper assembly of the complex [Maudiozyma saulgeensis]|uniref:SAGA complex subunit Spt7 n=1 Tax=Maudiozyma saulgeensis TaxID=1789683 RepID=A0A1X7R8Q6_9SACH|nr:similar to Saccharomyces cerevisiae YBR081C SPT7 Subunit of the SAGA transcriptional regulatory complex, involved in proper assembly of the complex [Kazachstania saulgeensis]